MNKKVASLIQNAVEVVAAEQGFIAAKDRLFYARLHKGLIQSILFAKTREKTGMSSFVRWLKPGPQLTVCHLFRTASIGHE